MSEINEKSVENLEKSDFFSDLDFESIFGRFWLHLGGPKASIFAFFREKMEATNPRFFGRPKNRLRRAKKQTPALLGAGLAVRAEPGGKDIG